MATSDAIAQAADAPRGDPRAPAWRRVRPILKSWPVLLALVVLLLIVAAALLSPWLGTVNPTTLDPGSRLKPPFSGYLLGTDAFGRDVWSRVVYGARISLTAGLGAAVISVIAGLAIG